MKDRSSMSRFMQVLRYELSLSWSRYATVVYGCLGSLAVLTLFLMFTFSPYERYYGSEDPMVTVETVVFTIALLFFSTLSAAAIGGNLRDKAGRISAFMLPATQLEKFMARWVIFIPLALIVFLLGFLCIDLLRMVMTRIFIPEASGNIHSILAAEYSSDTVLIMASYILSSQASFALGGMLWPKNSWVKTFAALSAIGIIGSFIMAWLAMALFRDNPGYHYIGLDIMDDYGVDFLVAISLLWTVVYHVIAYYRYKEMEIIQRW